LLSPFAFQQQDIVVAVPYHNHYRQALRRWPLTRMCCRSVVGSALAVCYGSAAMDETTVARIEAEFRRLSHAEQAQLLKRLQSQLGPSPVTKTEDVETQLAAMAADPNIRREIHAIVVDFGTADSDGLVDE
jgi:hypothetical protein